MATGTYQQTRERLTTYFDQTAAAAWAKLTSDAPVGRIRATVRAGRDRMRDTLLGWMPADLTGLRILDAGCGTGALAVACAQRGASVTAIDVSPTLIELARERTPVISGSGSIEFRVGDMLDASLGRFDYAVAMDSLIHYRAADIVDMLSGLGSTAARKVLFTYAPRTPALSVMHAAGRLIPHREHRAPAIQPIGPASLRRRVEREARLADWRCGRCERVSGGFYTSEALELIRQ